jgi:hypothetical protein
VAALLTLTVDVNTLRRTREGVPRLAHMLLAHGASAKPSCSRWGRTTPAARCGHVYTLHAELEGQKLAPIFEQLLSAWRAQGYQLASMADYYEKMKVVPLPAYPASWEKYPAGQAN